MRFLVFDHSADVERDPALYKLSAARGQVLIDAGAQRIGNKIRLARPANLSDERPVQITDWVNVHTSSLPREFWPTLGRYLRITTKQLETA